MSNIEDLHKLLLEKHMGLLVNSEDPRVLKEAREFLRDNGITVASIGEPIPEALSDAIVLDDDYLSNFQKEYKNG
jgi:ABC-type sugar transport system substrate-binding protein